MKNTLKNISDKFVNYLKLPKSHCELLQKVEKIVDKYGILTPKSELEILSLCELTAFKNNCFVCYDKKYKYVDTRKLLDNGPIYTLELSSDNTAYIFKKYNHFDQCPMDLLNILDNPGIFKLNSNYVKYFMDLEHVDYLTR